MAPGVHMDNTTVSSLDGTTDHHLITSNIVLPSNSCSQYSLDMRKVRYPAPHQANTEQMANDITSAFRNSQVHDMTIDDAAMLWQRSLKTVLDTHCPEKLLPIPTRPPPLPWQTPALHQLFIKRKTAHRVLVTNCTCTTARENFRALRRQSKILNSKARSEYYQHLFNSARTKSQLHWKLLNKLLGRYNVSAKQPVSTTEFTATFSAIVHQPNISNCLFTPEGPCMADGFLAFSEVNC